MQNAKKLLLVEDSAADVRLFQEAVKKLGFDVDVTVAKDGEQAIVMAFGSAPDLVVLNLNMPKLDGIEVLEQLREDPRTRVVPIVMYSSTARAADVIRAYRAGANCAVQKPMEYEGSMAAIHDICTFWLQIAVLPSAW